MAGFSVKSKGRSFIRGKSIDDSPRGSIVDWIIAEGGYPASGYFGGQFKEVVELVEARASIKMFYNEQRNVLRCVYLFILTAVTHVTQNTSLCRQRQLFRASPKNSLPNSVVHNNCFGIQEPGSLIRKRAAI